MPDERQAPQIDYVDMESEPLKTAGQDLSEAYALSLVKNQYYQMEWYRSTNHDRRWTAHDALYCGWIPQKVWDGTTVARSSLPFQITFDQVEAALPAVDQALFGGGEEWFQVTPEPGADTQEAKAISSHLHYIFEHNKNDFGRSATSEIYMAMKDCLLYGNGGIAIEWDFKLKRPVVDWVDLRDIYVDPKLPTPSIDDGRSTIRRKVMTVDELDALRGHEGLKIPPRDVLNHMARNIPTVMADRTKQIQEGLRGVNYIPNQHDWSAFPADRGIEVLMYYSTTRLIWVLNREWVAFNESNPYGFTPFCFAPCYIYPSRFYGQSFGDVLEFCQRYIEALMNARIDRMHLGLNPPRVKRLGGVTTPSQQRWRPGMEVGVQGDPREWMMMMDVNKGAEMDVAPEIQFIVQAAEKRTGVNSLTQSGTPQPSNANRSATGINAQIGGGNTRLSTIVRNIEDYLIVPMLYKAYKLIQYHAEPGELLPALGPDDKLIQIGVESFKQPVRFKMFAASKMMTKEKLQSMVPFLSQAIGNGPLLTSLHQIGKTIDWEEFFRMAQDAAGTSHLYNLVRMMTPEEQQAMNQPPPQVVSQEQQAQQDSQTRIQIMKMKNDTELQKAQLAHEAKMSDIAATHHADVTSAALSHHSSTQGAANDLAMAQQEMATKAQEAELNRQSMMQDLAKKAAEMRINQAGKVQDLALDQASQVVKQHQQARQAGLDHAVSGLQHAQKLSHAEEAHQQKSKHEQLMNTLKLKLAEKLNDAKVSAAKKIQATKPKPASNK